jgi:hypothetical protein
MNIIATIIGGLALIVLLSFLMSWPVYMLWNECLVGAVDGVHTVEWTTAWGISLLFGLLFKSHTSSK